MLPHARYRVSLLVFLISLAFTATRATAADTVGQWEGALSYRLDEKSDKLPNGRAVQRFRYRGKAGDVVWATLAGAPDPEGPDDDARLPPKNIVLEYDASGGRGEWEEAEASGGTIGFEIRAPANGLVEFRVRALKPGAVEQFGIDYGGDTVGAQPLCFTANELKGSIPSPGARMNYPLNVLRGNSVFEFEMWTDGYIPSIDLIDPKGEAWGFNPIDHGPAYEHRRYRCKLEGKYRLSVGSGENNKSGNFTLRIWHPLPLKKRK